VSPIENIADIELGVPVSINIDNSIGAIALAQLAGASADDIRSAMKSFGGVDRRFDFQIKNERHVLLSDYAHHPEEIRQSILSLREVFAGRKLTGIFQPHLYSRTNDFYKEFAEALSLLDEVVLTEIYPARELPIPGVTSELIFNELRPDMQKRCCLKAELPEIVAQGEYDVLVVLGAGDVENYMKQFKTLIEQKS
jgi:UDP-N-acetylmuramate--alanine ligase